MTLVTMTELRLRPNCSLGINAICFEYISHVLVQHVPVTCYGSIFVSEMLIVLYHILDVLHIETNHVLWF